MKLKFNLLLFFVGWHLFVFSQVTKNPKHFVKEQKGNFYFYWGWNRDAYSKSNINFSGTDYNFTLNQVSATDRQSPFDPKVYFGLSKFTIPQYNFRMGYYLTNHYQLSVGADHMKYVMKTNQVSTIDGYITNSGTSFDGNYNQETFVVSPSFLLFEHTDGLNYLNVEMRRSDILLDKKHFQISMNEGIGVGVLVPRTNTTLLNNPRYDEFHLSGYGFGGVAAINLTFFSYFFIQSELKGGFFTMPDIRTTMNPSDRAAQNFWWTQYNVVFGLQFPLLKKSGK